MIKSRAATYADAKQFYDPVPTFRGYVLERDDDVIAIAGLSLSEGNWIAFSAMAEPVPGKSAFRLAKRVLELAQTVDGPVLATADPDIPNSANFLARIGFTHVDDGVFTL